MSSSIEEEFSPPDWATKEEVIKAAKHYINYWKIEARQRNSQWLQLLEENARLKAEVERLKKPATIGGYNISEYIRMANSETLEFDNGDIFADMTLPERIKYIVESHARLKAEVERLRASSFVTAVPSEEYEKLKKEIENLKKSS